MNRAYENNEGKGKNNLLPHLDYIKLNTGKMVVKKETISSALKAAGIAPKSIELQGRNWLIAVPNGRKGKLGMNAVKKFSKLLANGRAPVQDGNLFTVRF